MVKYKNREAVFNRLHAIRRNIHEIRENNSELLVGVELVMLKAIEEKLKIITKRQKKRKENR